MAGRASILTPTARRWRDALLLLCAIVIAGNVYTMVQCTPLLPWCSTTQGFSDDFLTHDAGFVLTAVDRAAKNGLRVGDTVYLRDVPFLERWRLREVYKGYGGVAGERLTYVLRRGSNQLTRTITVSQTAALWPSWLDLLEFISILLALACATLLAARRPDLLEARALSIAILFVIGVNSLTGTFLPWASIEFALQTLARASFLSVPIVCLTLYASTFGRPLSAPRTWLSIFSLFLAAAIAASAATTAIAGFIGAAPVFWLFGLEELLWPAGLIGSLACAFTAARASVGRERQRIMWIALSCCPLWLYYALPVRAYVPDAVFELVIVATCLGLTYSVLSRRCVDLGYIFNRAVVFGFISAIVLAVFVTVEWALGAWFAQASRTANIVINLAVALALGLSLRFVHRSVERFVDRVLFRKRYEDETALRRFAHDAPFITSLDILLDRTTHVVTEHGDAESATVLLQNWIDTHENDPAVLSIRANHQPIHLHEYETTIAGEAAFPLISRGRLLGILVCGAKTTGEAYAPDEWESLKNLAGAVGHAIAGLTVETDGTGAQILDELQSISAKLSDLLRREDRKSMETPD
jgi:GAF domain-containing protein